MQLVTGSAPPALAFLQVFTAQAQCVSQRCRCRPQEVVTIQGSFALSPETGLLFHVLLPAHPKSCLPRPGAAPNHPRRLGSCLWDSPLLTWPNKGACEPGGCFISGRTSPHERLGRVTAAGPGAQRDGPGRAEEGGSRGLPRAAGSAPSRPRQRRGTPRGGPRWGRAFAPRHRRGPSQRCAGGPGTPAPPPRPGPGQLPAGPAPPLLTFACSFRTSTACRCCASSELCSRRRREAWLRAAMPPLSSRAPPPDGPRGGGCSAACPGGPRSGACRGGRSGSPCRPGATGRAGLALWRRFASRFSLFAPRFSLLAEGAAAGCGAAAGERPPRQPLAPARSAQRPLRAPQNAGGKKRPRCSLGEKEREESPEGRMAGSGATGARRAGPQGPWKRSIAQGSQLKSWHLLRKAPTSAPGAGVPI